MKELPDGQEANLRHTRALIHAVMNKAERILGGPNGIDLSHGFIRRCDVLCASSIAKNRTLPAIYGNVVISNYENGLVILSHSLFSGNLSTPLLSSSFSCGASALTAALSWSLTAFSLFALLTPDYDHKSTACVWPTRACKTLLACNGPTNKTAVQLHLPLDVTASIHAAVGRLETGIIVVVTGFPRLVLRSRLKSYTTILAVNTMIMADSTETSYAILCWHVVDSIEDCSEGFIKTLVDRALFKLNVKTDHFLPTGSSSKAHGLP